MLGGGGMERGIADSVNPLLMLLILKPIEISNHHLTLLGLPRGSYTFSNTISITLPSIHSDCV